MPYNGLQILCGMRRASPVCSIPLRFRQIFDYIRCFTLKLTRKELDKRVDSIKGQLFDSRGFPPKLVRQAAPGLLAPAEARQTLNLHLHPLIIKSVPIPRPQPDRCDLWVELMSKVLRRIGRIRGGDVVAQIEDAPAPRWGSSSTER